MSTVAPALGRPHAACEARLADLVRALPPAIAGPAAATLAAGGKRLRPALVLACAGGEAGSPAAVGAAAAVELMHMATLVHDDVIDGSPMRRGRPTVLRTDGAARAVQVGDALLASAFAEAARLGAPAVVAALAEATRDLTRGELLQERRRLDLELDEADYDERCRLKTGALLVAACRAGAAVAGAGPDAAARLAAFATHLGAAFQIVDDVLDLTAPADVTGKARGADLADGTITLPVILALRREPDLAPAVRRAAADPAVRDRLCARLATHAGTARAADRARARVAAALHALSGDVGDADLPVLRALAERVLVPLDDVRPGAVAA